MEILDGLNDAQKEAVLHTEGPLLIIAGAGAGKTKTLTHRIANLVQNGVPAHNILAITFTNKAAKEMKERVEYLMRGRAMSMPLVCTFHSLGVRLLREYGSNIGLSRSFSICDENESLSYIKEAMKTLSLDVKKYEPRKIKSVISKEKGKSKNQKEYAVDVASSFGEIVSGIWKLYEEYLSRDQALDFDDILLKTEVLLESFPKIKDVLQKRYTHIHVDEYQDTNDLQYNIVRLLVGDKENICVVGDSDQNIYSWRGANIKNILSFEEDFPSATVVTLEENYRSTSTILSAANDIISKNIYRKEKNLFTSLGTGEKISLVECYDEKAEANFIAEKIVELLDSGVKESDIAILFRANFQSRVLEEAMIKYNIHYHVLGTRFFDRKEVKDVLSYIFAAQNRESEKDLKRSISVPKRGVGEKSLEKVLAGDVSALSNKVYIEVQKYFELLDKIRENIDILPPSELIKYVIVESKIEETLLAGSEEDKERLENLRELVTVAKEYDQDERGLYELLDTISLASDQDSIRSEDGGVILMTIHAAKGLEYEYVFITGLEQDLFPHTFGNEKKTKEEQEEERRLMYVAVTRAKKKLFLTYAGVRTIYGQREVHIPSEFVSDIKDEYLEYEYSMNYNSDTGKTIFLD
ncbi:UvrD-helicase domain-containing protein [Candidatus Nomurabacteria bacterium]|nr:UvrD-helicase domain-containing protein [Candidatus Nomurabacteria bacterium]MCB9820434.1 UvrD-helicase domain-containing protein [Candidatus Nomurabacteria bacterium]